MTGIDTNVLLRWLFGNLLGEEPTAEIAAIQALLEASNEPVFVNHVVIVETIWVLSKRTKLNRATIAAIVYRILDAPEIMIHDAEIVRAAVRSLEEHPGDFADHLIGEINSRNGCRTTYTFDRAAARSPLFSELSR